MDPRAKLFSQKKIYDLTGTSSLFLAAMRENLIFHRSNCDFYHQLLVSKDFDPLSLKTEADLARIPPIPAAFFKRHQLFSIPPGADHIFATSSGTRGQKSQVYFDPDSLATGMKMAVNCFRWHGLISPLPTNYIMLGYEPSPGNEMGAVKTAMGATRFAPALQRVFMLRARGNEYQVNLTGVIDALKKFEKQPFPVRLLGFPAYLALLLKTLEKEKLRFQLPAGSRILLGGGWKQFDNQSLDKATLYPLAESLLGIKQSRCQDFYSALEHGVPYGECAQRHFHIPIWSRIIIRNPVNLEPVGKGVPGLLNFVTPLVKSVPLASVLMGDLAQWGSGCECGNQAPYFKVLGRAGTLRNCAVAASEWMDAQ